MRGLWRCGSGGRRGRLGGTAHSEQHPPAAGPFFALSAQIRAACNSTRRAFPVNLILPATPPMSGSLVRMPLAILRLMHPFRLFLSLLPRHRLRLFR
jgi:hypothetical protein